MQNETVGTLNDLVKINNDRIAGYERALKETKDLDIDLKSTFRNMMAESERYREELSDKIAELGGNVADGTTVSGKIYRAWMDVKATFTGSDRKSILESCEFGEDAAQRAYEAALEETRNLGGGAHQLIKKQQASLKEAHDLIKKYRDAHSAIKK